MIDYVWKNENAVDDAFKEYDAGIEEIHRQLEPSEEILYDQDANQIDHCVYDENALSVHKEKYKRFYNQYIDDYKNDKWHIDNLRTELQTTPIHCTKYNYTLEKDVMNHL